MGIMGCGGVLSYQGLLEPIELVIDLLVAEFRVALDIKGAHGRETIAVERERAKVTWQVDDGDGYI